MGYERTRILIPIRYTVENDLRQNNKLSERKIQHSFQYHCFRTGNSVERKE